MVFDEVFADLHNTIMILVPANSDSAGNNHLSNLQRSKVLISAPYANF